MRIYCSDKTLTIVLSPCTYREIRRENLNCCQRAINTKDLIGCIASYDRITHNVCSLKRVAINYLNASAERKVINDCDITHSFIYRLFRIKYHQEQSGAVEACWAHNPEVGGSKPLSASCFVFLTQHLIEHYCLANLLPFPYYGL